MTSVPTSRRSFLGVAALAAAGAPFFTRTASAAQPAAWTAGRKVGGFYLGPQAWTFRLFSVMEAIEMAGRSGSTVIEFFPGQKLAKDSDSQWDHNATEDQQKAVADQLAKWNITPMNYGVTGIPNEEKGARKIFEFAKKWGLYGVTTESADAVDLLDKLAQEYEVRVCFHNHPRQPNNPNYKVWDPKYILELTKDRSPWLGACADTGHWIRSGLDALECVKILRGRVLSMHLKDRIDEKSDDQVFGRGKANLAAILEEVRSQGFQGNISIEYETNWEHSLPDVSQCVGYIRGLGAAKGWT